MARYCSPPLSVRTRLSPPYRATIRLKVFQGRNSISWAKSVLPVFIKASRDHPGSLRQLQIVDTALCAETRITPGVQSRRLSVNRTAVILEPNGFGRCRISPVADASSESLRAFVLDNVEPGATVITDAWQGYRGLEKEG